jgi:D-3-phosphoglycerate dehydrogenase
VFFSRNDNGLDTQPGQGHGGVRRAASFGALVEGSDVLTFHCPLTPQSRGMLNLETLPSAAHPGLFVVNCARGGIAEEGALLAGLADGVGRPFPRH